MTSDLSSSTARTPLRRRTPLVIGGAVLVIILMMIGVIALVTSTGGDQEAPPAPTASPTPTLSPEALEGVELDALEAQRISELRDYVLWLQESDADGFVGELGWSRTDASWQQLAHYWYQVADAHGIWSTAWAAGSAWSDDYALTIYSAGPGNTALTEAYAPADVLEDATRNARHGVNLAGLEFGTEGEGFSAQEPGTLGENYFTEPAASFEYLAERGIDLVRLPFRWERLQPTPGGEFDAEYARTIDGMLDAAEQNGIDVVLDLHNYGAYETVEGTLLLGSAELPATALPEFWLRVGERWAEHPAVVAYGLMNEPHSLPGGSVREAATQWEVTTQLTVDALRSAGDDTLLMVPGYDYSSLARWRENHPTAWITDPADNFRYEAHHYWDANAEGLYELSYADELARFAN